MQVTIDISMYPNREDFIPPIDGFIENLASPQRGRLFYRRISNLTLNLCLYA